LKMVNSYKGTGVFTMNFNADRMQYLAGVSGLDDYRSAMLTESKNLDELDLTLTLEPADETEAEEVEALLGDLEIGVAVEEPVAAVEVEDEEVEVEVGESDDVEETVVETKLRLAIRKEIQSILGENTAQQEEEQFQRARQYKSVATALGWAGGNVHPTKKNRAFSRGAGGAVGFGGPGFM
jgi:hypothetical protein